ncbi:uncharacterized protein si:ch211-106e7.2 [Fundulus heteroclitus]|uniref:uncharacterized protein si:ch211-106e7.2 n=1 Tax=Fundulus heteroclitus TaxID=8078 RepID=UPI00165A3F83|nr:uncharacterized protein si:ch211-106e7.2 [Fundulus heteroclitus]
MHSISLMKAQTGQAGPHPQPSQVAAHLSQGSSGAYPANTTQQYMTGNSGFQLSQNANLASKNGANASAQMANWKNSDTYHMASHYKDQCLLKLLQPQYSSIHLQNENLPGSTTCASKSAPMQNSHQYLANQGLHSGAVTNSTYTNSYGKQNTLVLCKQLVSFNGAQTNWNTDALHLQQSRAQQAMQPTANPGMTRTIPSYNPAPSLPREQLVNTLSAAVCIGQTQAAPTQNYRQSFSQCGYSQNVPQSYGMATSQSSRNNSVATHGTFSNPQVKYASNIDQVNQHPSAQCNPSYNKFGDSRNIQSLNQYVNNRFRLKKAQHPLNHEAASGKMVRQNMHPESTSQASNPNRPPPYESHQYSMSRMSNPNIQAANILRSESYSLNASQSLLPHYGQHFTQGAMSRAQQAVNAPFQENMLPNDLSITTAVNRDGRGQVVPSNETLSERCPVKSQSNVAQGCERVLSQRNDTQAIAVSHLNSNGMPSPFKQNDSVSSMSGHTGIRAIAVVPPLSQEECHSPVSSEPCKSVNDAEEILLDEVIDSDNTCSREESNQSQMNTEKNTSIDETISDLEPENLAQTSKLDTHTSVVKSVQEVPGSQTDSVKQTEEAASQSPPFNELSLVPTKSWTTEALTKFVLEMEKAQPKPKDTSKHSSTIKILITLWSKNIAALIQGYNDSLQTDFLSDVENFCNTHIKEGTVVLTQVSPDFKDQLKRYNIIKDGEVYSEPPYKSLWLNVNDQLDDIDKEFGFPFALKRHLFVDITESQGHDFQTFENVPANEAVNKVLSPTESVKMIQENATPLNPPSSQHESPGKSSCDSKYSFKIKVLPPEEAKVIYEQMQHKQYSNDCEKETVVSDSGKQDVDIDSTLNKPKVKKSSVDQLEEICCLVRFIEMNSGLGKPSSHCQCKVKQNANKDTIETLKPHPDHLPVDQEDVNDQTVNPSDDKCNINVNQIIDLTDDGDDQLFSYFDKESEPTLQMTTCNQSNTFGISDHMEEDSSPILSSTKEMHHLVIKKRESEWEHVQEEPLSIETGAQEMLQSSDSACSAQLTKCDPSNSTLTKEPILLSNQEENCNQTLVTSRDQAESPSENKIQVSNPINQTYLSLHGNQRRNGMKKRRQSNLDHYFPSLKKPKKSRPPRASDPDHTSEPLHSASEDKTVELALFGAGQQESSSTTEKGKCLDSSHIGMSYEKHRPPGVLSVKLASSGRDISTADPTKDYSVKQLVYEKWRRSIPTMIGSVPFRHKRKLRRQTSLPILMSSGSTQEKKQTMSPELRHSISRQYTPNIKKNRALYEHHRCKETLKRSYSVSIEQPEHLQEGAAQNETSDGKQVHDGIVLKFSILPNTFNFTDGSSGMKEAAEPVSDKLEPIKKQKFSDKAAVKQKGTWYPSEAKLYEPLHASKNAGLFHEYQKKYKEKTGTLSVE